MDKNAVAFIRPDVRSLRCVFLNTQPSESAPRTGFTTAELLSKAEGLKRYTYLTTDPSIEENSWVVVMAAGIPKVVFVVESSSTLDIESNAPYEYSYVVAKVDFSAYEKLQGQLKALATVLANAYQENLRASFRTAILSTFPLPEQEKIQALLSNPDQL